MPDLPPLFTARAARGPAMDEAAALAQAGCDGGTVLWRVTGGDLDAAIVFAPERPLREAAIALPVCALGLQNALGALAPPEVAVHLDWDGGVCVNRGLCGRLAMSAPDGDPNAVPDWLVVGLSLAFMPNGDGGAAPDRTALYAEGCGDVAPETLLEAWVRHTLLWLGRWQDEGTRRLLTEWRALGPRKGDPVAAAGRSGAFGGVQPDFSAVIGEATVPLTALLTRPPAHVA